MTNKLINTQKSSKAYWSSLKSFLNNKKIPLIPPLFHENHFITGFKEKVELFHSFFANQCSLIRNETSLTYTNNCLSTVSFSQDVGKIIQNFNPNKAHCHDNISIHLQKNMWFDCLQTIRNNFQRGFKYWLVSIRMEKGNIVPIHKKGDKQVLKSYCPVSLLHLWENV